MPHHYKKQYLEVYKPSTTYIPMLTVILEKKKYYEK